MPYSKIPGNKVFVTCLPRLISFGNRCINSFKPPGFISKQVGLKVNTLLSTDELIESIKKWNSKLNYVITAATDEMIMMTKMTIPGSK